MSEVLLSLRTACHQLGDSKVAERKKGLETIKKELKKEKVQRSLDGATEKKHEPNWNSLFRIIQNYISMEAEAIKKSKVGSATAIRTQDKKKADLGSIFKWIVKVANSRGEQLNYGYILQYIFIIFSDDFSRNAFGEDAIGVLCRNILRSQKYVTKLKKKEWDDLFKLCTTAFLNRESIISKDLLSRTIHALITNAIGQCVLNERRLFRFFLDVVPQLKDDETRSLASSIVAAVNKFSRHVMTNHRRQLCNLGEQVFETVLHIWKQHLSPELNYQLIEFMQIQLTVHHPLGAESEQQGAYANDTNTWKIQVKNLYKLIYKDIRKISNNAMSKNMSGKDFALDDRVADLAADVFKQMLSSDADYIFEVIGTQTQFGTTPDVTAPKRRRIGSGWKIFTDVLSEKALTLQGIAWLQILTAILQKFPNSLPKEELAPLLNILLQASRKCKRSELQSWLLQCMSALAMTQKSIQPRPTLADRLKPLWKKVWSTASIAVRSTQHQACNLLCILLISDLVNLDKEQWSIFVPGITKPTWESVNCLALCLQKTSLFENYREYVGESFARSAFPLRWQLLQWLISVRDAEGGEVSQRLLKILTCVPADLYADMLVSLVERTPSVNVVVKSKTSSNDFQEAAELYLKSDFISNGHEEKAVIRTGTVEGAKRFHDEMLKLVTESLNDATSQLVEAVIIQEDVVMYVLLMAVVIQKVLIRLVKGQIMTFDMIYESDLYNQFKELLQNAWNCLSHVGRKSDLTNDAKLRLVSTVVSTWTQLYTLHTEWEQMSPDVFNAVVKISQKATPKGFIEHLLKISSNEILNPAKAGRFSPAEHIAIRDPFGNDDEVDMDVQTDDEVGDMDTMMANATGEDDTEVRAHQSILSDDGLLAREHLSLKCLRLLASYSCLRPFNPDVLSGTSSNLVEKLLQHLDQEDKSTSFGLQSCLCITETLLSSHNILKASTTEALLKVLREIASFHRKNHEVCTKILTHLQAILRRLSVDGISTEDMDHAKMLVLDLLCIFRTLNRTNMYSSAVRLEIARCVEMLIQLDPNGNWSVWQQPVRGNADVTYKSVIGDFPDLLLDPDHRIRMLLAHGVQYLFQFPSEEVPGSWCWFSKDTQNSAFDLIYQKAQQAMPQQQATKEQSDEFINRSATLLHALATIAKTSIVSRKKAVFALVQTVKLNGLAISYVSRVISSISSSLKYPSALDFLLSLFGFLVSQWLDVGYPIFDFPHQLFNCNTKVEFFTKYHHCIIPYLVMYCDNLDDIERIAKETQLNIRKLLQDDFPQYIVRILPFFAHVPQDENNASHIEDKAQAMACFKRLEGVLGKKDIDQLIQSNLDTIVVELLLMLHEPVIESSSSCSLEPSPPYFLAYKIQATLDYLTACHGSSQKTLIALLSRTPDSIQNILLHLQMCMQRSYCNHEKQRLLVCYRFFVTLLLKELDSGLGGAWAFVLHDMIHTLLHVVSSSDDNSCSLAVAILHRICTVALGCYHQELGKLVVAIVRVLVPLANQDRNASLCNQAVSLLNLLAIEGSTKIADSLQYVDPLPDVPCLNAARESLDAAKYNGSEFNLLEEMNHFLVCNNENNSLPTLQSLKLLHQKLARNRDQMKQLLTDDQESIRNLITSLVSICNRSGHHDNQSNAVQQEAACCLGEIGPVDLCTVSLKFNQSEDNKSYATAVKVYEEEPHMIRKCIIIHSLKTYLTGECVRTKQAAVECLKSLLATPSGIAFREDYVHRNIDQLFLYLHPFRPHKQKRTNLPAQSTNDEHFTDTLNDASLWQPESTNHEDWICRLTCALIDSGGVQDEFLRLVKPVCKVKAEFAEQVLAFLVHDILTTENDHYRLVLSNHIQSFFAMHCGDDSRESRAPTPMYIDTCCELKSKHSTLAMLQVVQYLRTQQRPSNRNAKSTAWDNNFWLELDYLVVAKAAKVYASHFTCILYTEIWCDQQGWNDSVDIIDQTSLFETLSWLSGDYGINVQQQLLDSYRNIGEPDGIYGYGASCVTDTSGRIHTYEHEGSWMKALSEYDKHLLQDPSAPVAGLIQGLKNAGLHHVMDIYLKTDEWSVEANEHGYETAWRLSQWDEQIDNSCLQSRFGFHEGIQKALTAIKNKDDNTFKLNIDKAEGQVLYDLCHVRLDTNQNVYPLLCELQMLIEVKNSMHCITHDSSDIINESWKDMSSSNDLNFKFIEPILAIRSSILDIACSLNPRSLTLQDVMSQHLWSQTKLARKANHYNVAERSITRLSKLIGSRNHDECRKWGWQIEMAKVFWAKGELDTAKHILKEFIVKISKSAKQPEVLRSIYPQALGMYGQWLAETHTESPNTIMDDYLEKAVNIYDATNNSSDPAIQAYLSLARFSDTQYQKICSYMTSQVFKDKQALLAECRADLENLQAASNNPSKYQRTLEMQQQIDETEVEAMDDDKSNYLHKAVNWYLKCLTSADEHDVRMFRVCSLWFDNANDPDVNCAIETCLKKLESRKFLPLIHQLAARITSNVQGKVMFHQVLHDVICKTIIDHPHHTLPVILALANADKDSQLSSKRSVERSGDSAQIIEERMIAAQNLLESLKSSSDCSDVIISQDKLSLAYIKLAYFDVSMYKRETKPIKIPSNQPIVQIKNLEHVAMPTLDLPVDPSCNYDDIVYVKQFEPTFKLAGGVNLPKILSCVGSNGLPYTQLVKGRDDLRQDAVMQQVFGLVNSLLLKNPETRKRKLHVRQYKVIPLSQTSGLLEWCAGTMPLGQYLTGNTKPMTGAHKRYRPSDWTALECRKKMTNAGGKAQKYTMFQQVMKKFKPVLRYFFMEKFVDPDCWFERRLAYTRSVATSSIVGYIVGLGDRHVQNILIDCNTAELIHIDLGVAFEQGRILPTPETVPFRLTRDIEDGMGVASVEGVFRICCEKTMQVMHNSCEALLTILEVLLHDPLYDWTMSPLKACNIQQPEQDPDESMLGGMTMDSGNLSGNSTKQVNKMAKRVLLRLREKLQGKEEGRVLSVSGQVSRLIQEARDVKNLSGLFAGWQPWL